MSDEKNRMANEEQPKAATPENNSTGELTDDELDNANGGILIALNQPTLPAIQTNPAVSPSLNYNMGDGSVRKP